MFRLQSDDDGHWYVVPTAKSQEWSDWLEADTAYWKNLSDDTQIDAPEFPAWAVRIDSPYTIVFPAYEEEK